MKSQIDKLMLLEDQLEKNESILIEPKRSKTILSNI
jgi:hypothetical protein